MAEWRFLRFTMIVTVKKSAEAEKRLDNSPSMPYNNYCCAGVAHLVERDLAKVEVASSSLVARSKKETTIRQDSGSFFVKSSRGSKGRERSEKNMPVACFGTRVRVAARQGRQRASSPAPKKDTRRGVFLFRAALLLRKSGRLRAGDLTCKENPTKVSLAYIPFLAIYRSAHGQQNL